ncbi:MAG TPA: 50S ribosomal protein L6 [Emcibacteraceae bacterium]|nr:50S ribosomal protein L6 [Emcibacteraceae bacterium]HRW28482.1 50S ribosomal protein L6 [Emcibacteraceae bacterium]
MSRIGKKSVQIPAGVEANLIDGILTIKGPKGSLNMSFVNEVDVKLENGEVSVMPRGESKRARSMWGMQRTLVSNLVEGVTNGFSKTLELNGVGYRAQMQGRNVNLQLGYSHDILYEVAEGVEVNCPNQTTIIVSGIDKQKVGQVAAEIREFRKPEPYKGKGVKYSDEYIFRKEGKKK